MTQHNSKNTDSTENSKNTDEGTEKDLPRTGNPDPRVSQEDRVEEFRRVAREIAADAPTLAQIKINSLLSEGNPLYEGSSQSAGRAGRQSGNVSELTALAELKPGGADRMRRIFNLTGGNFDGAQRVSTLHNMRFVFFDDDTRIIFATAYDGDWDTYINDFATKIPELMDLLFANVVDWPGIDSPEVKDFIAGHQIDAAGWFVANPQVTVVDVRRMQRMEQAVEEFLDTMGANDAMDPTTREALKTLSGHISTPVGVDY